MTHLWPAQSEPHASCRRPEASLTIPRSAVQRLYLRHSASPVALIRGWTTLPKEAGNDPSRPSPSTLRAGIAEGRAHFGSTPPGPYVMGQPEW
jgi:hypothetical protein